MKIIALYGRGYTGKTTTIKKVFEKIKDLGKIISYNTKQGSDDIYAVIDYNGIRIGITSAGDNDLVLIEPFAEFKRCDCDIVLCASRVKGKSVKFIEGEKQKLVWIKKTMVELPSKYFDNQFIKNRYDTINEIDMENIIEVISQLCKEI